MPLTDFPERVKKKAGSSTTTSDPPVGPPVGNDGNGHTAVGEDMINTDELLRMSTGKDYRWGISNQGRSFKLVGHTIDEIPAGTYAPCVSHVGERFLVKTEMKADDLIDFPGSITSSILQEIKEFWTSNSEFVKYGFLHRRGYLFYGPPGGGKSCLLSQIIKNLVADGGIVLNYLGKPEDFVGATGVIRAIEPERKLICVFEDIDSIIERHGEAQILNLLDGNLMFNHVLNLATTNYPERLERRIVSRPRRFDQVVHVGMPEAEVRREYFKVKLKIEDHELDEWVAATKGFSFASLCELVVSVKCFKHNFETAVLKLRELADSKPSSIGDKPVMGFGASGSK